MKIKILHVLVALTLSVTAMAQSVQRGVTLEYRGKDAKTALAGVAIAATNAGATLSDGQGLFALNFRTLRAGDQIQLRRVELAGYEVMNVEALEVARVARTSGADDDAQRLQIIMAPTAMLRRLKDGYRSVAVQRYQKELKAAEAEVERLRTEGSLAEDAYNSRLDAIEEEYEQKLSRLETYIDKFARIDVSDLDADEQQVIDMVQAGDFEAALAIYDRQNLADRLRQNREDQAQLMAARERLAEAENKRRQESERLISAIDRQATLLLMAGGADNLQKAYNLRREAFEADRENVTLRRYYAGSLMDQGQIEASMQVYRDGLALPLSDYDRGFMTGDLMNGYYLMEEYDDALRCADEAEGLLFPLKDQNYTVLTRALPYINSIRLMVRNARQDYRDVEPLLQRIETYWEPDTLSFQSLRNYSNLLVAMAECYAHQKNHERTLWCVAENLRLSEMLQARYPAYGTLMEALVSACTTYNDEGRTEESLQAARRYYALLTDKLTRGHNRRAQIFTASHIVTVLEALVMQDAWEMADSLVQLEQQWKIFDSLKDEGLAAYYAEYYYSLCVPVALHRGALAEAEVWEQRALSLLRVTGSGLVDYIAPLNKARICFARGEHTEAASLLQQSIDVCEATYRDDNDPLTADLVCRYSLELAEVFMTAGNKKAARAALRRAEQLADFAGTKLKIEQFKQRYK